MRLAGTKLAANHQYRGFGDQLYDLSGQRPSLDLQFANQKSLVDATTGQNLVTFTRASSGTYVDSQGVIRTATTNEARFDHNPTTGESLGLLVEESRTNGTTFSQDFDNVAVSKNNATVSGNVATSPAGNNTADKLVEDSANSEHGLTLPNFSYAVSTAYTFTVFAKAVERSRLRVLLPTAAFGENKVAWFDLSNGSVIQTSGTGITSSIFAYTNGWYRCAITATTTVATSSTAAQLRLVNTGTTTSYTGDGSSGLLLWGAQLEAGAFPTSYIPTTTATVTRSADVASITGSNFGVSRTNLLLRSEEFDNASWTKGSSVSVSANTVIAPNGTLTADTVTADSGFGVFQTITSVIGVNYSNSIYVKAGTAASMMFRDDTGAGRHIIFNPLTGVITSTAGTLVSSGSQAVGDGWYRYWMVYVADATSVRGIIRPNSAGSAQTFAVWGAQLEAGSTATAYIPTTTAAVTVVESPWYRQDEGTVFAEAISPATSTTVFAISDGSTNNRIQIEAGSNTRRFRITSSGTSRYDNSVSYTLGTSGKSVGAYIVSGSNHATNGVLGVDLAGSPLPVVDRLLIGTNGAGLFYNNGTIRRLTYWPTRLPNETLQGITQ